MKKLLFWSLLTLGGCLACASPSYADAFGLFPDSGYCCKPPWPQPPANAFAPMCYGDNAFTIRCISVNAFTPAGCNPCASGRGGKGHGGSYGDGSDGGGDGEVANGGDDGEVANGGDESGVPVAGGPNFPFAMPRPAGQQVQPVNYQPVAYPRYQAYPPYQAY